MAWAFGSADLGGAARVGLEIYPAALRGRFPGGDGAQPNRRFPSKKTHPGVGPILRTGVSARN